MSVKINKHLFTETGTDSGALNVLGTLVHRFTEPGDYLVTVTQDGRQVGETIVVVDEEYHSRQATIDLSSIDDDADPGDCDCSCEAEDIQCIRPGGFAVFSVSSGAGGYRATVDRLDEGVDRRPDRGNDGRPDREPPELDSQKLRKTDTFAATLMRPGQYRMINERTDAEGEIQVAYPDPESERPAESVRVKCTDDGFDPESVEMVPAQGLVFDIEAPSRIRIALEKPHERAAEDPDVPDVVEPSRPGGVGRPGGASRPGDGGRPGIDPADLSVDELESELPDVDRRRDLLGLLRSERDGENRSSALEAIRRRLREIGR